MKNYLGPRERGFDLDQAAFRRAGIALSSIWQIRGRPMATSASDDADRPERIPLMQRVLDNPFLLLFLGVTIPTVLYILWGVMEVASVPLAK
jgi:hypothetical protein